MDLRQLAALVAIADHGSFSAAAKALYTVQSNVSAHIARLERELGARLVDRSTGRLTDEGEVVVLRARRAQAELDALLADLASRGDQVSGEVRLGVIGTTARWLAPRFLTALRDRHPLVRPVLVEATTTSLVPQLVAGQLDLAVVNLPVDDPDVATDPLFGEEMIVLASSKHPLAQHTSVSFAELAAYPLVLPAPGTALREELDGHARHMSVTLVPLAEVDGMRLLTSLALEGIGAAVVPATSVPGWIKGDFSRIAVPDLPRRLVGVARRRRSPLSAPARAVRDVLGATVRTRGPRQPGVHLIDVVDEEEPGPGSAWPT